MAAYYFNRLADLAPDRQQALLFAAQSLNEGGDPMGAIAVYEKYLQANPKDAGAAISYANLAAAQGIADKALGAYNSAYQVKPSGEIAVGMGRIYLNRGNDAQAALWFDTALRDHPEVREDALLGELELALKAKQYEQAEDYVAQLKKDFPGSLEVSSLKNAPQDLANWRARQEELKAATEALAKAKAEAEKAAKVTSPGTDSADADAPETTSVPMDPNDVAVAADRFTKEDAVAAVEREEAAASNPVIEQAPAAQLPHIVEPVKPVGPLELARKAREEGNLEEAARLYPKALAQESSAAVWNEYSELSLELGNSGQAFAASLEATRMDPYNAPYAMQYLRVAQSIYEPRRFMGELLTMRRRFPESPVITLALARAYWQVEHNARNAGILYDEFLLKYPNHPLYEAVLKERDQLSQR